MDDLEEAIRLAQQTLNVRRSNDYLNTAAMLNNLRNKVNY